MASVLSFKMNSQMCLLAFLLTFVVGIAVGSWTAKRRSWEGFANPGKCNKCGNKASKCQCEEKCKDDTCKTRLLCPPCKEPDMSKYVLKSSIPPCVTCPDMSNYMLKTECPPAPDLSKYILKSSIPKQQPIIIDNSSCKSENAGECPPCPRPRCPAPNCPSPSPCPAPAPCPRPVCPKQEIKCKAETQANDQVRPLLAPIDMQKWGRNM